MGAMSKVKKEPVPESEPPDEWKAIQLTPEQKAKLRAQAEEAARKAAATGVYERLLELRGKVKWDLDLEELRKDRD
jgi:hypothetical protein